MSYEILRKVVTQIDKIDDKSAMSSPIILEHKLILFEKKFLSTCIFTYTNEKKSHLHVFSCTQRKNGPTSRLLATRRSE